MAAGIPYLAKIKQSLQELQGAQIIVGVQADPGTNFHGQTVAADDEMQMIAHVHEFGADITVTPKMRAFLHHNGIHLKAETAKIHIPERSYIRRAHAEGRASFQKLFNQLIGQVLAGKITADELLETLGKQAVAETVANMGDGTKPVTEYTLEHRKSSKNSTPLVDTGDLQNHITYHIEKGGSASGASVSWSE